MRALAALSVAVLHIADEAGALVGTPGHAPWGIDRLPLEAGVDLFFVVSGFVLVWTCWDAFGSWRSVPPFLARRLLRVAPLYWLLTAFTVAVALARPGLISDGLRDGWGYVAASALFWPWRRLDGFVQPVLRLGWTLQYEMFFYALLACALPLRRAWGLGALLAALALAVAAGQVVTFRWVPLAFWTDPIVAEFAFGVVVAVLARRGWRPGWWLVAVAFVAAALLHGRVLAWGLPATALVGWSLSWPRVPRWAVLVGDASYALYLVHPFPMRALRVAAGAVGAPAAAYIVVAAAVCVLLAILLHLVAERPLLRLGRRLTG